MKGAGEKAFCAGGDVAGTPTSKDNELIQALVTLETPDNLLQAARENYFRHEYTLDYYLSTYDKPMIAVMDGITSASSNEFRLTSSGWRSRIEYKYSLSNCNREDRFCYARDTHRILPGRRRNIFSSSFRWRIGNLSWSDRPSIESLRHCVHHLCMTGGG